MENEIKNSHKRKRGRKRKRGPKKKRILVGRGGKPWEFKVILCRFKKEVMYINKYRTVRDVERFKSEKMEENARVVFPVRFSNNSRRSKDIMADENEYVILRQRFLGHSNIGRVTNEYGKSVEVSTNSDKWYVYDRFPHLVEESFWVYGFDPKSDRKSFSWIYNNLVKSASSDLVRLYLYNNKVIIEYDDDFNFVICKNTSDSIRFYNLIEDDKERPDNVVMLGMVSRKTDRTRSVVEMIREKTGWSYRKIYQRSTRS